MTRKNNPDEINLQIDDIRIAKNELCPNGLIRIEWSSNIGFGQYDLKIMDDGFILGDSELMDSNEDKAFISKLMQLLVDRIKVK